MKPRPNKSIFDSRYRCVLVGAIFWATFSPLLSQEQSPDGEGLPADGQEATYSSPLEEGKDLAAKGKLGEALPLLRKAADAGSIEAQELCALALVKLNQEDLFEEAKERLAKAAENGSLVALEEQARLAVEGGLGSDPDYELANRLLQQAVKESGASEAFFLLGKMAAEGLGRERDPALAVSLMRRGEEAGSANAMFALGQLFLGEGGLVERDLPQAVALFQKSYERNNGQAAFYLGMIEERLRGEEPNWKKAWDWFQKASKLGEAAAFRKLGDYVLANREGQEEDVFSYYQQAAELKDAAAAHKLGMLYHAGRTVPKDQVAAAAWMRISADWGYALAQNQLALWLLEGLGITPDYTEAIRLLEESAGQGYPSAQFNLAVLLMSKQDAEDDLARPVKLLKESAEKGHIEAAARLSSLYQTGKGVEPSNLEAAYWAARAGRDERFKDLASETRKNLSPAQEEELAVRLNAP